MRTSTFLKDSEAPIEFHKCLIQLLGSATDSVRIDAQLIRQRVFIQPKADGVLLRHPPYCPMINDPPINSERNVDVGVCGLLESKDEHILLTRRSQNLRTFPGSWVPPGGTVDPEDPSLLHTCMRELAEETGLHDLNLEASPQLFCCWESAYPSSTSMGPPIRHHLVLYYLLKSGKSRKDLEEGLSIQREEVGALTWISAPLAIELANHRSVSNSSTLEVLFPVEGEEDNSPLERKKISTALFLNASSKEKSLGRITTGSSFAIGQWAMTKKSPP